ncbi:hypothetical protein BG011_007007 [Mortierella polycephala]|uniref:Uncharacterized protein n=1 Tax=Mortierella polycephala TaxID=41804 RepID=A0A9P6PRA3_9FUNG|nr:hypothetical protein BG011_007007 [Mortierella polycephala]
MRYTFNVELNTDQPFVVDLHPEDYQTQVLSGAIAINLGRPEKFKAATIAIHGHVGIALNIDSAKPSIVYEPLMQSTVDLVAANDMDGSGVIRFEDDGIQYLPFRIDIPRPGNLPSTLINKLDTHYIDWKYEIHATLQRDSIFSLKRVVKHDLIFRRPIPPKDEDAPDHTVSTDMPKQFKSKLTVPKYVSLGQDSLAATVKLKARDKSYMIKEIDCAVVQTEDIDYFTKRSHPSVEDAEFPGVPCKVNASRLVSVIKKIPNDDFDLEFGHSKPIEMDVRLDNMQLIPTERGLDWLEISHVFRFTIYFMDVNLQPLITELPLIVGHEEVSVEPMAAMKAQTEETRMIDSLKISDTEDHIAHSRSPTPELA